MLRIPIVGHINSESEAVEIDAPLPEPDHTIDHVDHAKWSASLTGKTPEGAD